MVIRKSAKILAVVGAVLTALVAIWLLQRPGRDAWNISVASAVSEFRRDLGFFPRDQKELLLYLGDDKFNSGFLAALEEMHFKEISEADFLGGEDLIEIPGNRDHQRYVNRFIRIRCDTFQESDENLESER